MSLVLSRVSALALFAIGSAVAGCVPLVRAFLLHEQIITADTSPDERYVATVFQHAWGPPTKYATYVTIWPSRSRFKDKGMDYDAVFAIDGARAVGVVWANNSHLRVICIDCKRDAITKGEKGWRDVSVSIECIE